MNKRRQTHSPRLLYLALAAVVLGPTAPPLPAQGTGKRVIELRRYRDPRDRHLALEGRHGQGGPGPPGPVCRVPGAPEGHERASGGRPGPSSPAMRSRPSRGDPSSSMPRHPATPRPLPPICARSAPRTSRRSDAWCRAACPSRPSGRCRTSPPCSSPVPLTRPRTSRTWAVRAASRCTRSIAESLGARRHAMRRMVSGLSWSFRLPSVATSLTWHAGIERTGSRRRSMAVSIERSTGFTPPAALHWRVLTNLATPGLALTDLLLRGCCHPS